MQIIKKVIIFFYLLVVVVLASATIMEKYYGTSYVARHVYGAAWFSLMWTVMVAVALMYFIKRKVRRPSVVALHAAFAVILCGALLTHLTGRQGSVHLRADNACNLMAVEKHMETVGTDRLPFSITLKEFEVKYHEGTSTPYDYVSHLKIDETPNHLEAEVSMNNIFSYKGYRLYQSSYDSDMMGSVLKVNYDPFGLPVTYVGYALLFLSLLWMLIDPKGRFCMTLKNTSRLAACVLMFSMVCSPAYSVTTLSKDAARKFARLNMDNNGRISPVETFALDFTKSLTGKRSHEAYNATQVLAGFALFPEQWSREALIKVPASVQNHFHLPSKCALQDFFRHDGYLLGPTLKEYWQGSNDKLHKDVAKLDDVIMLVMQVSHNQQMRLFPYQGVWSAPADSLSASMPEEQRLYVRQALTLLAELANGGDEAQTCEMLDKMWKYQKRYGGASIPSDLRLWCEHAYNALPFTTILFIVCLTLGFLSLLPYRWLRHSAWIAMCWGALSLVLLMRWIISGTIPMANGYETMLLMAWLVLLVSFVMRRQFPVLHTFGLLLSGFFLLVSHISQLSPQIGHVMPVLQSPLLSAHVSVIMMAYALLSITALCAAIALVKADKREQLMSLSVIMLYPAIACLGMGIFIGAIWANVSWGTYWSWDPKETWALITFMIYSIPVHYLSLPCFRNARTYHIFMLIAFLSVIITYFGVNYLLGGMHSYA